MKTFSLILVGGLVMVSFGAAAPEARGPGDWSEPVNGLRGRLSFGEPEIFNGTRLVSVYLELQNVSDRGNPMEIYFDIDRALECELFDPAGKPVPKANVPADIETPSSYWITLPHDSTLRFRVSVSGHGIRKDDGRFIGMMSGAWGIPATATGEYSLASPFRVEPPSDANRRRPWRGVLQLPKAKVPTAAS